MPITRDRLGRFAANGGPKGTPARQRKALILNKLRKSLATARSDAKVAGRIADRTGSLEMLRESLKGLSRVDRLKSNVNRIRRARE